MYYKSQNIEDCKAYDKLVTESEKINATYPNDNYANPIEINGEFYILKHKDYESEMELVSELPQQDIELNVE